MFLNSKLIDPPDQLIGSIDELIVSLNRSVQSTRSLYILTINVNSIDKPIDSNYTHKFGNSI